jgi:hypothetical protein
MPSQAMSCPSCGDQTLDVLASRIVRVTIRHGKQYYAGEGDEWVLRPESPALCAFCGWQGAFGQLVSAR